LAGVLVEQKEDPDYFKEQTIHLAYRIALYMDFKELLNKKAANSVE